MGIQDNARQRGRPSLARKVDSLVRREHLFAAEARVLVMVSGGQDSLALLHVLASGGLGKAGPATLSALHINHHLRGAESDADESLVAEVCERLGAKLTVVHRPVEKSEGNVQERAREARRAAALEVAQSMGWDVIVLGHTADDQVETLLYRIARYGGLAALAGMRPNDPPWARPLLDCRREETAAYCRDHGIEFASDSGNTYPGYARTRIRENVLPAWEEALPGAVGGACRTAEVAAEIQALTRLAVAEARAAVQVTGVGAIGVEDDMAMSCTALLRLPVPVRRLLLHDRLAACSTNAASRASVLAVEALLEVSGSASRSLGGGWQATKEYDLIRLGRGGAEASGLVDSVELPVPGAVRWAGTKVSADFCTGFRAVEVEREAIIDASAVSGVLQVRGPRPGDRMQPLGSAGSRKVKEILIDLKVPARERPKRPMVVCGERILWLGGLVIADEARVTRVSKRFVRLSMARVEEGDDSCAH